MDGQATNGDSTARQAEPSALSTYRPEPELRTGDDQQPAHRVHEGAFEATFVAARLDFSKADRDLTFAMASLRAGHLTERQLAKAVSNWTVHGDQLLAEHLVDAGLLSATERDKLETDAESLLQGAAEDVASGDAGGSGSSSVSVRKLDATGRVARLLGLGALDDWGAEGRDRVVPARYQLLKKLGQGGLGCVWLARDQNLKRFVAVKEISEGARELPAALGRFRREAEVTGRLEHPSIVPVYQFGDGAEGHQFYVMRYLGKETLADAIAEYHERREAGEHNPLHLHRLLTSFVAVCQAIGFAHSRDVVHRDLKPDNVALDNYGQVLVLDWGLAKLVGEAELDESFSAGAGAPTLPEQTLSGEVLGTPRYMAPEQAAGRIDEIDQRTDVYGLGAILFAILTGYAPHEKSQASSKTGSSVPQLLRSIVNNPTPLASALDPDVPKPLEAVCAKAMARKRYARYASATELADDIQRWMAGEPVTAYREPWLNRVQRWVGRHPRLSQLIAASLTVLVVSAVTSTVMLRENYVAEQGARFESLKGEANTLEDTLRSKAIELGKAARFMTDLPPIAGLIAARDGDSAEGEPLWRERLEMIYTGLLNAHPDYLSVEFAAIDDKHAQQLVRVERQAIAGSFVQAVPQSRLARTEVAGYVARIASLKPGEVYLATAPLTADPEEESPQQALVLTAGVPVYDDTTGALFGLVAIESNLDQILREIVTTATETAGSVYFVEGDGRILLHYSRQREFRHASAGTTIEQAVPELGTFFSTPTADAFSDESSTYAVKVGVDPRRTDAALGIVLTLD